MPGPDDDALAEGSLDRDALLAGGRANRRRRAPQLLFLLESWSNLGDEDVFELLGSTDAFATVPRRRLGDLLALLEPRHIAAGDVVFSEGETADALYVVAYGRLRAERVGQGERLPLDEIGPGGCVGQAELIAGTPRRTTVRAVRDSLVLRLSADGLSRLAQWHPELPLRLARQVLRQVTTPTGPARQSTPDAVTTLAVVPAGRRSLPPDVLEGFVEGLAAALAPLGSLAQLSSGSIDAALGDGMAQTALADARNGQLVEWLQRAERAHRLVLYVADDGPSDWTRRCLRQADRVVLLASAEDGPGPGEIEEQLLGEEASDTDARRELVLLHRPSRKSPVDTAAWLTHRAVATHHHVRVGDPAHLGRLARLLTGHGVGVVFGGGGARGSAHLGVVQALEDAGVPVDAVGGTSIGSVAAFMAAMGWDHRQRLAKLPLFFSTRLVIQPTVPLVSLSSGRRLQRRIAEETGGRAVEDLWIRFFSVSTNLSRATQVVHDRGDLALALRASVSLPGILPPVQSGSDLLVDGGLLNNLPIDVMQAALGGGRVVAVDLRRPVELKVQARLAPALSGWHVLARRLLPGREPFDPPSVGAILQRSFELAGLLNERSLLGRPGLDLYLSPPVGRYGTFDFASAPLLVDEARRYTADQLTPEVLARLLDPVPAANAPSDRLRE